MEETTTIDFGLLQIALIVISTGSTLLALRGLWVTVRQKNKKWVISSFWLLSVVLFCAWSAILFGTLDWLPYTPDEANIPGQHDPTGMSHALELLLYNAVIVVISAVLVPTLVIMSARKTKSAC